jgi:gamma-glutamyltranspeptidase/glutathione hydrolase
MSTGGMVASAHPLATSAGVRTLAAGGNAVDAAVSAALAASVVLPAMCGVGGDLFAIVADQRGRSGPTAFLSSGIAPRGLSLEQARERSEDGGKTLPLHGPLSPSVPGFISGVFSLLERYGTKSFAELAESAIGYAANGHPVTPGVARWVVETASDFERTPTSAAVFLPSGKPIPAGAILRQENLARSLRAIAEGGPEVFYTGAIAREIASYLAANGGALTVEDFADHATAVETPISTCYRGHTIYQTGLPTQGFVLLEALNIVANDVIAPDTDAGVHLMAEALKRGFADRNAYAGDPTVVPSRLEALLSPAWAAARRRTITDTASAQVDAGSMRDGDTTYLCAVDGDGLMITLIISLSDRFGSGVIAGETGIMLNNRAGHCFTLEEGHPNVYAPGKKTMHTLNCYLIADGAGTPLAVGGTPGGDFQPQWNTQVISGLLDAGLDAQAAVELPRWCVWPGTYPREVGKPFELRVEDRLGPEAIAGLERRGHTVARTGDWGVGGSAQVIVRDPETGAISAGSDPRSEGVALGL